MFPAQIEDFPANNLGLVITIPCHNEPDLNRTLRALTACTPPACAVEIIVVINGCAKNSDAVKSRNKQTFEEAKILAQQINRPDFSVFPLLFLDLPPKHAGVGLARKIAMDEAVRRYLAIEKAAGPIICLDADSLIAPSYLQVLFDFFEKKLDCQAASIYYEHPLEAPENPNEQSERPAVYAAITAYELHLRYYVHALKKAGLPTATQTVGSSMAVRADAYAAQGGMNRRKAGEDFYFIHKFTGLGGYRQITDTKVIPSPRISDRVPFGTGKAVGDMLAGLPFTSYNPLVFKDLRAFLSKVSLFFSMEQHEVARFLAALPLSVSAFLEKENFSTKLEEIQANTSDEKTFIKRFFQWFDAFLAMKYVHFVRDGFYPNLSVLEAARTWLVDFSDLDLSTASLETEKDVLLIFRALDKEATGD